MSCVPNIGRTDYDASQKLPRHSPKWTEGKARRLHEQAIDSHPRIRATAASNPRITPSDLLWLMQDGDLNVRVAAVKNTTIRREMLRIALADTDPGIVAYARMMLGNIGGSHA